MVLALVRNMLAQVRNMLAQVRNMLAQVRNMLVLEHSNPTNYALLSSEQTNRRHRSRDLFYVR
jgi:hypothetical protein